MRIFHILAFNGSINSTMFSYDAAVNEALGSVDLLHVGGYASQVTGTNPTMTLRVDYSANRINWSNGAPILLNLTLSTTGETVFQAVDSSPLSTVKYAYARIQITLGGTSPQGRFAVWVTGRDRSRRSRGIMQRDFDKIWGIGSVRSGAALGLGMPETAQGAVRNGP